MPFVDGISEITASKTLMDVEDSVVKKAFLDNAMLEKAPILFLESDVSI